MSAKKVYLIKNEPRESGGMIEEFLIQRNLPYQVVELKNGEPFPDPDTASALIVLGGPDSANDETPLMIEQVSSVQRALQTGTPYLGICLGLQIMVKAAGGRVVKSPVKEIGFHDENGRPYEIQLTFDGTRDHLFYGVRRRVFRVFQLHGETVELTPNLKTLAKGSWVPNQVVCTGHQAYGIQYHPELTSELFEKLLAEDDDLKKLNPDAQRRAFREMEDEYRETGLKIIENFFAIAGLIGKQK